MFQQNDFIRALLTPCSSRLLRRLRLVLAVLAVGFAANNSMNAQMIVAHRGASFDAPENTLAAFNLAWQKNADAIEGDFRLTKDGQIVCVHDKTTERTAPGHRSLVVAETSFDELETLDVGTWKSETYRGEKIPTLAEVLATVPKGKKIFVEIKCGVEIAVPLQAALKASKLEDSQIVIISFNEDVIKVCREQMPQYQANWLTAYSNENAEQTWQPTPAQVLQRLQDSQATGLGSQLNLTVVTPELVNQVKAIQASKAKLGFHVWTVDDPQQVIAACELGVDSITTNRPEVVRNVVAKHQSQQAQQQ